MRLMSKQVIFLPEKKCHLERGIKSLVILTRNLSVKVIFADQNNIVNRPKYHSSTIYVSDALPGNLDTDSVT